MQSEITEYLLKYRKRLENKDTYMDMFLNIQGRPNIQDKNIKCNSKPVKIDSVTKIIPGDIIILNKDYVYVKSISVEGLTFGYLSEATGSPIEITTRIKLKVTDLENLTSDIETTVGRFVVNYIVLVKPFGNKVKFHNDVWDIRSIEKQIAILLSDEAGDHMKCTLVS